MTTQNQIGFITGKIQQLQTAILECHSNSLLKLPRSVVQTLYVDEVGCVWVAVSKPKQYLSEFDQSFHVALNYYRKGSPFFLNTYGLARVVADPEDINHLPAVLKKELDKENLLICIRILEASYYEKPKPVKPTLLQKCRQSLSTIFWGSNDYYHFNFDDPKNFA